MKKKLIQLLLVLTLSPTAVLAHHKPGHQPPGQVKKSHDQAEAPASFIPAVGIDSGSDELVWSRYVDEEYGFEIALPLASRTASQVPS